MQKRKLARVKIEVESKFGREGDLGIIRGGDHDFVEMDRSSDKDGEEPQDPLRVQRMHHRDCQVTFQFPLRYTLAMSKEDRRGFPCKEIATGSQTKQGAKHHLEDPLLALRMKVCDGIKRQVLH